jgi:hypothetical protein
LFHVFLLISIFPDLEEAPKFYVYYKKDFLMEADSFIEGVQYTIGLYYVTETLFPKTIGSSMEFMQRCFFSNYNMTARHEKMLTPQNMNKINKLLIQLNPT